MQYIENLINWTINCAIWIRNELENGKQVNYSFDFRLSGEKANRDKMISELNFPEQDRFCYIVYLSQLRNLWNFDEKEKTNNFNFYVSFWISGDGTPMSKSTMTDYTK